jgi:indolepyruvate ferredoxin oxidoreductase
MTLHDVSLADRFDLSKRMVLLGGIPALVRALLMQKARDEAAGLVTAGYATGYRGSPLGGVDQAMLKAGKELAAADVRFEPGLNEDLAATALWGSQQAELRGEGRVQGVFGLWYGKGPGVDRCGDVFRHANMAGTSRYGGVVACLGDDHTAESSTVLNHSEFALADAMMPILSPAGVQEVLDYALLGWALSRYSGCWVGLKCVKDTIEVTEVVDGDPHRLKIVTPSDFALPPDGLNIRLHDTPVLQEARLHDYKRFAAEAFARANRVDRRVRGDAKARIGIVSCGKSWLDTTHALDLLGLDDAECRRLGIATYKVGMVWPLDMESFRAWAHDLEHIIVVEEKRKLVEVQIKEAIFDDRRGRRVTGWKNEKGETVFTVKGGLDPVKIARTLGQLLALDGIETERLTAARTRLDEAVRADNAEEIAVRKPWFCSGCPHNTSTRLPEGARGYAGIGCHYMVQWMDRETEGFTHMGGEGANWIGEAPFSTRRHIFQNLGDGTYNHSGLLAIRAALAAGVNITYKILYNDAVAMTGGQPNEGGLTAPRIARELQAMGVKTVVGVYDEKEAIDRAAFPAGMPLRPREELDAVQREMEAVEGVSAIVYIQTCAAEKRRRRKRGTFPDPDRRVFINPDVCEGCGDCGVQSNCVSIAPLETEFGRKRAIDQSSCNKDFSCLNGFCPSFVTLEGARVRKTEPAALDLPPLPAPRLPDIAGTYNIVVTGVGGTGVVTVGALLAMAAHLEGKGAGEMEMAGLAQKGGAVHIHVRIAEKPADISAIRVAVGEADAVIGGDLVTTAGAKTLGLMTRGRTRALVNAHEITTGDFTRDRDFRLPTDRLTLALRARLGDGLTMLDATRFAEELLGDAIYANVMMLGAAWQAGMVPLSAEAIDRAVEINGAGVAGNRAAFAIGRWAVAFPRDAAARLASPPAPADDLATIIARRAEHLEKYQGPGLARRYRARIAAAEAVDTAFASAMAKGYHKLLACKDEYEVARLHVETTCAAVDAGFTDVRAMRFHLAPPFLGGTGPNGRPRKRSFGPWMLGVFGLLRRCRFLRGTAFDPFGYSAERRAERRLREEYEADMDRIEAALAPDTAGIAAELAALPLEIRGFGPVKAAAMATAAERRAVLLAAFAAGGEGTRHAAE